MLQLCSWPQTVYSPLRKVSFVNPVMRQRLRVFSHVASFRIILINRCLNINADNLQRCTFSLSCIHVEMRWGSNNNSKHTDGNKTPVVNFWTGVRSSPCFCRVSFKLWNVVHSENLYLDWISFLKKERHSNISIDSSDSSDLNLPYHWFKLLLRWTESSRGESLMEFKHQSTRESFWGKTDIAKCGATSPEHVRGCSLIKLQHKKRDETCRQYAGVCVT